MLVVPEIKNAPLDVFVSDTAPPPPPKLDPSISLFTLEIESLYRKCLLVVNKQTNLLISKRVWKRLKRGELTKLRPLARTCNWANETMVRVNTITFSYNFPVN